MTFTTLLAAIACVFAGITLVVKLAELNDETRSRLVKWTTTAGRVVRHLFALGALLNGLLGVAIFWLGQGLPSRQDILTLVLFLLNVAIGIWHFSALQKKIGRKDEARLAPSQPLEPD